MGVGKRVCSVYGVSLVKNRLRGLQIDRISFYLETKKSKFRHLRSFQFAVALKQELVRFYQFFRARNMEFDEEHSAIILQRVFDCKNEYEQIDLVSGIDKQR